jgi:hypothetical protein
VLQNAHEVNSSLSNADTSISVIGSECWKNDGTIMDVSVASQTVFEGDNQLLFFTLGKVVTKNYLLGISPGI